MDKNHTILNHLDKPVRLLVWPASQVLTVVIPTFVFLIFGRVLNACIVAITILLAMRWYKKRFGSNTLIGLSYWILPHNKKLYRVTPPSHIREYLQ